MKREILLVGGRHAGRYIKADDHPTPSIRFPIYRPFDWSKDLPPETICQEPEYEVYQLQKYRSANGAEFFWYVLEGIDPLEELTFIYSRER